MTLPNDELVSHLAALHHLRETEQRPGIDPLRRTGECPTPSELIRFAGGESKPENIQIAEHVGGCRYCQLTLKPIRAFLFDEPLDDLPDDDDRDDPTARWIESGEPLQRKTPTAPVASGDTNVAQGTSIGFTQMAHDPQMWPALLDQLRPWAPLLLSKAGLDPAWAGEFLAYIETQLSTVGKQRFTSMLDQWFVEFARARHTTPAWRIATATLRDFEPGATRLVLSERQPDEPDKVARLRTAALARETLTQGDLLNLSFPDEADSDWVNQQLRAWYYQAGTCLQRARELFEVG